jgi:hypothetical protein
MCVYPYFSAISANEGQTWSHCHLAGCAPITPCAGQWAGRGNPAGMDRPELLGVPQPWYTRHTIAWREYMSVTGLS